MTEPLAAKPVSLSAIHDQTAIVFPNDLNPIGTLFGGRVLEQADWIAGVVARRHAGRVCVTLGVDSVRFLAPARGGEMLVFQSAVNRVWRSSMEVGIKTWAETLGGQRRHIFSAYFTFVGVDDGLHPVAIAPVQPETEEDRRRYDDADRRRQFRLTARHV